MSELNVKALKALLREKQLSEAKLARKIGVTRSCVNRIVRGQCKPSFKFFAGLKKAFPEYPIESLFLPDVAPKSDTTSKK